MRSWLVILTVCALGVPTVHAANTVVIESKTVAAGATGVEIGVYLENDDNLIGITLPLEIRTVSGGAYPSGSLDLAVVPGNRLDLSGMSIVADFSYPQPAASNSCSGPVSNTYDATQAGAPDYTSPMGFLWSGLSSLFNILTIGTDGAPGLGAPSVHFVMDVSAMNGEFEVDTCCITPGNYLDFVSESLVEIYPAFTKGVINVVDVNCNADPVDVNCDGITDVFDVVAVVDVAFRSATPPPPCCK